jgi:hypothetical protein
VRPPLLVLAILLTVATALPDLVRPLSGIRFTGEITPGEAVGASNGRDFLIIWQCLPYTQGYTSPREGGLYGQRIVAGKVEPAFLIDRESVWWRDAAVVWTGSNYVVGLPRDDGIFMAIVSAEGHVIRRSKTPVLSGLPDQLRLTVNDGHTLMTSVSQDRDGLVGILLDRNGDPIGPQQKLFTRTLTYAVAAAGDGYAIAIGDWHTTTVVRVAADGTLRAPAGTVIEGPYLSSADSYHSSSMSVSSDDTNIVVTFVGSQWQKPSVLKSVVLALDGTIAKPLSTILTMPANTMDQGLSIRRLIRDGTGFVALLAISFEATNDIRTNDPALLRINHEGQPLAKPEFVVRGSHRQEPFDLVSNLDSMLVMWLENSNQEVYGLFFAILPQGSALALTPQRIGRGMATQQIRGAGTRATDRLIAWAEQGEPGMRLSLVGPAESLIKTVIAPIIPAYARVSITSNGTNWLLAWPGAGLSAMTFSAQLEPMMPKPLVLGYGDSVTVAWSGKSYVIVSTTYDGITTTVLSPEFKQLSTQMILKTAVDIDGYSTRYSSLSLAALEDGSFLTFAVTRTSPWVFGGSSSTTTAGGLRLDSMGLPATAVVSFPDAIGETSIVTDGQRYAVLWRGEKLHGTFFNRNGIEMPGSRFVLEPGGASAQIGWDGMDFIAAWNPANSIEFSRISPAGLIYARSTSKLTAGEAVIDVALTAGPAAAPIVALTQRHEQFDNLWHAGYLLLSDVERKQSRPDPPVIISLMIHDDQTIDVAWTRQRDVYGYTVDAVGRDGLSRIIDIIPSDKTTEHVSLDTFEVASIRMRSWNGAGFSDDSAAVPVEPVRTRAVRRR